MRFTLLFTSLILFLQVISLADYRPGYIITLENDTINGIIDYKAGNKNFMECRFKQSLNTEIQIYRPGEIIGYKFEQDKFFRTSIIEINESKIHVFFETIISGKVSLHKYQKTFYIEKDNKNYKLYIEKVDYELDGKNVTRKSTHHIGLLNLLLSDCSEQDLSISSVSLTEKSLVKLIQSYNKCVESDMIIHKNSKPWFHAGIGLSTGLNLSKLSMSMDQPGENDINLDFSPSLSAVIGISLQFNSPRINERIYFLSQLLYFTANHNCYFANPSVSVTEHYDLFIHQKGIKLPLGFKYAFPEKKIAPFITGGLVYNLIIDSKYKQTTEIEYNGIVNTFEDIVVPENSNQAGFWGGIGLKKSIGPKTNISAEVRYEMNSGITNKDPGFSNIRTSTMNILQFQISVFY